MTRCTNTAPKSRTPQGMTVEQLRGHPTHRYHLGPGAQCEHDEGHEGPHRNGGLIWHDPPVLYVGGERIW